MAEPVLVVLPVDAPRLAVLQTAYLLMTDAVVAVGTRSGAPVLELWPRGGADPAALPGRARLVFENQRGRWAVAERGLGVRAELTRRMLALAERAAARPEAAAGLPPEEEQRLSALLAETGEAEKDPLGIRRPWSGLRRKG